MADKVFDPEQVERHPSYLDAVPLSVVAASDYDALLALYREAVAKCPSCGMGGGFHLSQCPGVNKSIIDEAQ